MPPLSVKVLLGERALQLQSNTLTALADGRIRPVEVVARRPS
jgi:hypothetical protein